MRPNDLQLEPGPPHEDGSTQMTARSRRSLPTCCANSTRDNLSLRRAFPSRRAFVRMAGLALAAVLCDRGYEGVVYANEPPGPWTGSDARAALDVYRGFLESYEDLIAAYTWQNLKLDGSGRAFDVKEPRAVCLTDFDDDGVPELVFAVAENDPVNTDLLTSVGVYMVCVQGAENFLFLSSSGLKTRGHYERWDSMAWGSSGFCLFRSGPANRLCIYYEYGEARWYMCLTQVDGLPWNPVYGEPLVHETGIDFETGGDFDAFYEGFPQSDAVRDLSAQEYEAAFADALDQATEVLMYSNVSEPHVLAMIERVGCSAMTFSEAYELCGGVASPREPVVDVGRIYYELQDGELDDDHSVYLGDTLAELIEGTPTSYYDTRLSWALMALSWAAYDPVCSKASLASLGLGRVQQHNYYEDPFDSRYSEHSVAFSLAEGVVPDGRRLVCCPVRGSYGKLDLKRLTPDWASDFHLGAAASVNCWHEGFSTAADEVLAALSDYLGGEPQKDAVYVLCGHSRGAAVANLVSVLLERAGVPKENVYDYNFACPDVARGASWDWNFLQGHNNIWNIGDIRDPVSQIPGVVADGLAAAGSPGIFAVEGIASAWGKFGRSYWFSWDWDDVDQVAMDLTFSAHEQSNYLEFLQESWGLDHFKTWSAAKACIPSALFLKTATTMVYTLGGAFTV